MPQQWSRALFIAVLVLVFLGLGWVSVTFSGGDYPRPGGNSANPLEAPR